jgi:hypothetical protein
MYMDESPLHCSDPEASIAVPEHSIRIDGPAPEQFIRMDCTSDRIQFQFVAGELQEFSAVHGN